jgi:murein L,D-transpeptidase YcbB/YkuD
MFSTPIREVFHVLTAKNTKLNYGLFFTPVLAILAIGFVSLSRVEAGETIHSTGAVKDAKERLLIDAKVPAIAVGSMRHESRDAKFPGAYVSALRSTIQSQRLDAVQLARRDAVQKLYKARNFRPIWTRLDHKTSANYQALLQRLEASWTHGLNPDQYRVELLKKLKSKRSASAVATREILASDALIRYVSDLIGPRTMDKDKAHQKYGWRKGVDPLKVLAQIGGGRDLDHMITARLPNSRTYKLMQAKLRELTRKYRYNNGEKRVQVKFEGILHPGDSHDAVRQLRKRLDVPPRHNRPAHVFSDALGKAVMAFQDRHGLDTDAIVGPSTRAALNRTTQDKIEQLIANLQRMRWLAPGRPDKYLIVNIPAARLWAVEDGRVVHRMDVIAGRPYRETPSFVTKAKGVRLNPKWSIPYTVKFRDVLPEIREDPGYLTENNIELVQGYGRNARRLDPRSIDWDRIPRSKLARMRMIQQPGDDNPLGHIRILMPNRFSIFLHDTDKPEYFQKGRFWISSGCIRMREPGKIADFVMNTTPDWSKAKMQRLLKRQDPVDLEAKAKLPVYILYQTVWKRGNRQLVFGPDIYNRDDELVAKLRNASQIYIPEKDELTASGDNMLINVRNHNKHDEYSLLGVDNAVHVPSLDDPA